MIQTILKDDYIVLDLDAKDKHDALNKISAIAYDKGVVSDANAYYEGLLQREKEVTTGFGYGFAIPHARIDEVVKSALFVIKFKNNIVWESLDDKPVSVAFVIAMTNTDEGKQHLQVLALLSRKLMHEDFRNTLKRVSSPEEIMEILKKED